MLVWRGFLCHPALPGSGPTHRPGGLTQPPSSSLSLVPTLASPSLPGAFIFFMDAPSWFTSSQGFLVLSSPGEVRGAAAPGTVLQEE